eukprot:TRINITY_DN24536_c0_g1_i2.p1 TRINITY_DN24536_c0_g1~~TRINITY_DN24536_c0_g1_i2.p1  ORF type:complete len:377 (-),score=71.08 TRINITY_DN24536_c0_g1_i2:28-1134(-)
MARCRPLCRSLRRRALLLLRHVRRQRRREKPRRRPLRAVPLSGGAVADGASRTLPGNYVPEACRGSVIVHRAHPRISSCSKGKLPAEPFLWNAPSKLLTVSNRSQYTRFAYLTFSGAEVVDCQGRAFEAGETRDEDGYVEQATTFVLVVEPATSLRLGTVDAASPFARLHALPFTRLRPPPPLAGEALSVPSLLFPLPAAQGPYLCTQGVGGHLTHFFPESYYAIDFRCPCGTPILAAGDGVVVSVAHSHRCGGIHCGHLQVWNSVAVRLTHGVIVEYLHIAPGSSKVQVGAQVKRGQVLCESGDAGFAPEPHVHVELHRADDPMGPSLPLRFHRRLPAGGAAVAASDFVPVAGRWYDDAGEVDATGA